MSSKAPSGPAGKPIGVFVLDDHEIVRGSIRGLLEAEPDIAVIGEAGTASAALARIFVKLGLEQRTQAAACAARAFDGTKRDLSQDMTFTGR